MILVSGVFLRVSQKPFPVSERSYAEKALEAFEELCHLPYTVAGADLCHRKRGRFQQNPDRIELTLAAKFMTYDRIENISRSGSRNNTAQRV